MNAHPRIGEYVTLGARRGTYLGRRGIALYVIKWDGEQHPRWVPSANIDRTGQVNHSILEEVAQNISSNVGTRRRGGLRKGPRKAVGHPGGAVTQGRAGSPDDPRNLHTPVEDEETT